MQIEGPGLCLQLTITAFPTPDGMESGAAEELNKKMLQCTLRMQGKVSNPRVWVAEFLFRGKRANHHSIGRPIIRSLFLLFFPDNVIFAVPLLYA